MGLYFITTMVFIESVDLKKINKSNEPKILISQKNYYLSLTVRNAKDR